MTDYFNIFFSMLPSDFSNHPTNYYITITLTSWYFLGEIFSLKASGQIVEELPYGQFLSWTNLIIFAQVSPHSENEGGGGGVGRFMHWLTRVVEEF